MGKDMNSCSCSCDNECHDNCLCKKHDKFYDNLKAQFCDCGNVDEEIIETFNDLKDEVCDLIGDVEKIEKLFCRLVKLLVQRGCITPEEAALLKAVHDDILALKAITAKTARDLKCLERIIL